MVSPDGDILDSSNLDTSLHCQLSCGPVLIKASHGGEIGPAKLSVIPFHVINSLSSYFGIDGAK